MISGMFLNDDSCCHAFCCDFSKEDEFKLRQKHARLTYTFGVLLLGIFTFFVKNHAEYMFWFVYPWHVCYARTTLHSCFTLVMVYRISVVMVVYHLILSILGGLRNMNVYKVMDFCWTLKIIFFMELFFLSCVIPNWFFTFLSMLFKWILVIFILMKTIFLHDAIFYYCNKGRYATNRGFTRLWTFLIYFVGIVLFLCGLGIFIYTFIIYDPVCNDYIAINVTMICLASLHLVMNFIKYRVKPEFASSLCFFFVISVFNYGIIAATPHTRCVSGVNVSFLQNDWTTNLEDIFNFLFLMLVLLFLSRESMTGVNMTLSKYSRKLYEGILLDFEEKDQVVYREEVAESRFNDGIHRKMKVKRNRKDATFHLFLMAVGAYFSMLYTSWTTIWNQEFTTIDVDDNSTIWIRFSATVAGIAFCIFVSSLNLKNLANY